MSNRHLSRSVVLQVLFERDGSHGGMTLEQALSRLEDYIAEFGARESDRPFMQTIVRTAIAKQPELDEVIRKAAPDWPLERIAAIDRSILRLGLTELLFSDRAQVPAKVAINESIELAKEFGGESSSKFVNGVLGAVYLELGEPGKDEGDKRKEGGKVPMRTEECVGSVIYAREGSDIYLALVHDIFGHWTLSKGKLQDGEDKRAGVVRKAKEETGLDVVVEDELGENEYVASDTGKGGNAKKRRHATYFLSRSEFKDLIMKKDGGLDDAQWFPLTAVGDLNFYDDILPIVTKAVILLAQKK
ncbi:transcription antitermination factor NusB [bacterium]|nr:transcription antitermination factor NusB [bacterium]